MSPTITSLPEIKCVGLGTTFISIMSPDHTNDSVIPDLWEAFAARSEEIKNKAGDYFLGVCDQLPPDAPRYHEHQLFYLACVPVTSFDDVPEGMMTFTVPAAKYAMFTHVGRLDLNKLDETMRYIYGEWLPKSGFQGAGTPDLEWYDDRFKMGEADSEFDIYVPVK